MALFEREIQHEPRKMLRDLTALYQLHYGLTAAEAKKLIRKDTKEVQLV